MKSVYSIADARLDDLDRAREECAGDDDEPADDAPAPRRMCGWCCGWRDTGNHEKCRAHLVAESRRRTGL